MNIAHRSSTLFSPPICTATSESNHKKEKSFITLSPSRRTRVSAGKTTKNEKIGEIAKKENGVAFTQ